MTPEPKVFELRDEHGIPRTERDRLVNQVDDYLIETCSDGRAKRITVTIALELKGERHA